MSDVLTVRAVAVYQMIQFIQAAADFGHDAL